MHPSLRLILADEATTATLASALARMAVAGDLIRLQGDLGAGKSTLARYFLNALGHKGDVPSPTYTLVQTYEDTRFPVAHVDCYRLENPEELTGLGLDDYRRYGITLVEWPDKGGAMMSDGHPDFLDYHINSIESAGTLTVTLAAGDNSGSRVANLDASPSWQRRFALLPALGVDVDGITLSRPVSETGRKAFLEGLGLKGYRLEKQGGDWSGRSYARVTLADGTTRMLMDAPPPQEDVVPYMRVAEYYRSIGLRAARVEGSDTVEGYLLTEDFGDVQLFSLLQDGSPETAWYKAASDGLALQCQSEPPAWARRYSPRDWWVEVMRFVNWYMPYACGHATSLADYARWQALWTPLYDTVMRMPTGVMMWDCQSPNLMVLGEEPKLENLGWIDIQDARVAPLAQDAALLLRNIRTGQDDAREAEVVDYLCEKLGLNKRDFMTALDITSLHHSCRILGGLVRLHVRDGKSAPAQAYLQRTWKVAHQSFQNPVLAEIADFMRPWEVPGLSKLAEDIRGAAA